MSRRTRPPNLRTPVPKTQSLPIGSIISCSDTSGCIQLKIIGVKKHQGSRGSIPHASIGDMVTAVIHDHTDHSKIGTKVKAIIIRQKKPWHRMDGQFSYCEDNAAVLVNDNGAPPKKKNQIISPITKK